MNYHGLISNRHGITLAPRSSVFVEGNVHCIYLQFNNLVSEPSDNGEAMFEISSVPTWVRQENGVIRIIFTNPNKYIIKIYAGTMSGRVRVSGFTN